LSIFQALILGIVQGATEFLPISSSGHLVLLPWWFGWDSPALAFATTLHLGTLVAVIAYFYRDLWWITLAWLRSLMRREMTSEAWLGWWLILGTVPAVV
jgi:undecaprenyl-diphosphatase